MLTRNDSIILSGGQVFFVSIRTYGVEMSWEVPGSTRAPTPDFGVYSIGEANKENYTQLAKTVYEIVYNLCNLLIFSVNCGA